MRWLIRVICLGVVRLFYREIGLNDGDRLPESGPTVFVANHPNGLMDPIVIQLRVDRPVAFLAKSTLFANPLGRTTMEAFHAIPVYRRRDGEDTSKNDSMFDACYDRLEQGGAIVLFPEGTSHSDPHLRPLKTGAARIALNAIHERSLDDVTIVPVGLLYDAKEVFRSRVGIAVGRPISAAEYADGFAAEPRETVDTMTTRIAEGLRDVVLEADDGELWQGFIATARATDPASAADVAACERRARELAEAYGRMLEERPAEAESILAETRHYVRMLHTIGFEHPFLLEPEDAPTKSEVVARSIGLALLAPFVAIGVVLGWPTWKLLSPLSRRLAGTERDIVSTIKTIAGMVLLPLTFAVEGLIAAWFVGWPGFVAVFCAGFLFGRLALWWAEQFTMTREAVSTWWLRVSQQETAREVLARRDELAHRIESALDGVRRKSKGPDALS